MKRWIPTFAAGMLTAAVIGGLGVGALAASGAVTFNASNLQLNGQQISAKGENYTLPSGQQVPASITYTDETGGGTTYLPVRRIAELLGVETGWDSATGSVTVAGDVKPTDTTSKPDTAAPSTDYSDWSAEEEAAYQEFKGMWEIEIKGSDSGGEAYYARYSGASAIEEKLADAEKESINSYTCRLLNDLYRGDGEIHIHFFSNNEALWRGYIKDGKAESLYGMY